MRVDLTAVTFSSRIVGCCVLSLLLLRETRLVVDETALITVLISRKLYCRKNINSLMTILLIFVID